MSHSRHSIRIKNDSLTHSSTFGGCFIHVLYSCQICCVTKVFYLLRFTSLFVPIFDHQSLCNMLNAHTSQLECEVCWHLVRCHLGGRQIFKWCVKGFYQTTHQTVSSCCQYVSSSFCELKWFSIKRKWHLFGQRDLFPMIFCIAHCICTTQYFQVNNMGTSCRFSGSLHTCAGNGSEEMSEAN